jgi:hypothetical protein
MARVYAAVGQINECVRWMMPDLMMSIVVVAAVLTVLIVGFAWRSRSRARRRRAVLDAYSEREIARAALSFGRGNEHLYSARVAANKQRKRH